MTSFEALEVEYQIKFASVSTSEVVGIGIINSGGYSSRCLSVDRCDVIDTAVTCCLQTGGAVQSHGRAAQLGSSDRVGR